MSNEYLKIGRITSTHGVRGEVNILPLTDDPQRFSDAKDVFLLERDDDTPLKSKIEKVKYFKGRVVAALDGIEDPDTAKKYKNFYIVVDREHAVKLPKNSYFICDVIGMEVVDDKAETLGRIKDVIQTGANDVYVVARTGEKDLLIPAIKEVILNVDLEQKIMDVKLPDGLLEI